MLDSNTLDALQHYDEADTVIRDEERDGADRDISAESEDEVRTKRLKRRCIAQVR